MTLLTILAELAGPDEENPDDLFDSLISEAKALARKSRPVKDKGPDLGLGPLRYTKESDLRDSSYILLQVETLCRCGHVDLQAEGVFIEKLGRHERILRRADPFSLSSLLPRKREVTQRQCQVCIECAPELGF